MENVGENENIINIYITIKDLYKKTFENKQKTDFSKLSYTNTIKYDETNIRNRNQNGFEVSVNSNVNVIDKGITVELPEGGIYYLVMVLIGN